MNLYHDKYSKYFFLFLFTFSLLLLLAGFVLCAGSTRSAGDMLLSHDEAIASSLLSQGVAKDVIAMAMANERISPEGTDFLAAIGRTRDTAVSLIPSLLSFQKTNIFSMLSAIFVLSLFLFGGAFLFFRKREYMYQETAAAIKRYIDGDFSHHLPQNREGTLYQIFHLIEQLATILQAKNEAQLRQKIFLKNTISDISHQLKTPLFALSMYQEIMENEPENPEVIKEFAHKTGISLKRMEQLIQAMLKITRLDAGNIIFAKNVCPIPDLIQHSLTDLTTRAQVENKNLIVETAPAQDALSHRDASPSADTLICDREWTGEAIGNIVKNALDHTKAGDTIRISWECSPFMTRIMIADNGDGIAPEDMPHIFKRFYRSRKSLDTQGAGLGLPLAKSIMEGQGGTLSVQSILHEGTTFSLTFLTKS